MANPRPSDVSLRRSLPYPLAAAWHGVALSVSDAERLRRAMACLDTVPRMLVALLLPDYLRGEPVPAVEDHLKHLKRPSLGHWVGLVRELCRALRERDADPFVPEALTWMFDASGRASPSAAALDLLVARRNTIAHGPTLASRHQVASQADSFVDELQKVMAGLAWLRHYRMFRVVDQRATRRRTAQGSVFAGRVQALAGQEEWTEPVEAEWDAPLIPDAVYLVGPHASGFLEISPFVRIASHPSTHTDHVFLVVEVKDLDVVVLEHGVTGARVEARVESDHGEIGFSEWLDERLSPFFPATVMSGAAAAPAGTGGVRVGAVLDGRYEIREAVGQGESRQVFRALDTRSGGEVAIRVLGDLPMDASAAPAADRLRRLDHPGVVRVLELSAGGDGQPGFLAMPFVGGPSLRDRIATGSLTPAQRRDGARQILDAVGHLQEAGVVHGRLRPSSFLFDGDRVVLGNLGIPSIDPDAEPDPAYLAPEISRGGPATLQSDRYAAAAVLHELVAGVPPPVGSPGQGVDGREGRILRKLGARDPAQRSALRDALRSWVEPSTPQVPGGWPVCAEPVAELLRTAWDLAVAGGHGFLGIEHLVLALRRDARDAGVRRLWMLVGDTELVMRASLAGLTPTGERAEPRLSLRLEAWQGRLDDGFDAQGLEDVLRGDLGHLLHEVASAGPMLGPQRPDANGSTLGVGQGASGDGPCEIVVVGGPEDGRVVAGAHDHGWLGRFDGSEELVIPLYRDTPCSDLRLSRRHLLWDGERIELRRPARALSPLGDAPLRPGSHRLPPGTLIELTPSTRIRLQPTTTDEAYRLADPS
ncbi:MAG: protein kinase [Myxococcota bacterium]